VENNDKNEKGANRLLFINS
jgi:hypothetical protein